jgi:hypothetical protein
VGLAGSNQQVAVILRLVALALFAIATLLRPSLFSWTLLAMLGGIELGLDAPGVAVQTRFLGDLFLRLIRTIISPLLFATVTTGIAGHGQLRSIGRVALKAFVYFEIVTTLGLVIGIVAMYLSGAGWAGACPGPLFALMGNGVSVMIVAIVSALLGIWAYGFLRSELPHLIGCIPGLRLGGTKGCFGELPERLRVYRVGIQRA